MHIISAILISTSANLDTFVAAISYGMKKIKLNPVSILLITLITTCGTYVSMYFGLEITKFISISISNYIGSIMLICIGICMIINYIRKYNIKEDELEFEKIENITYIQVLNNPIKADKDFSGHLDVKESIFLALALTINNVGIGISASIAGINIYLNTFCSLVVTIISLYLGLYIGNSYLSKFFGKYVDLVGGLVILLIGFYEFFI